MIDNSLLCRDFAKNQLPAISLAEKELTTGLNCNGKQGHEGI